MKIAGFGDSFISLNTEPQGYLNQVGKRLGASVGWHGKPSTGSWDAFFQFKNYRYPVPDVAVFCWSDFSRFYHPNVRGICANSVMQEHPPGQWDSETWYAARKYYEYLFDYGKSEYEAAAFYLWFDEWSRQFSNIKFIHLWSFSKNTIFDGDAFQQYKEEDPSTLQYHHRFKHGAEIRPALMHFSVSQDWPQDLSKEKRQNHLADQQHSIVADLIIEAINNYEPGRIYAPES